ncbi:efflux system membrane protein [compost metagenome]
MELREWALAGVLFSPFVIYVLLAMLLTGLLRQLIRRTPLAGWIWHEALFDSALFVCVLAGVTAASAALT